MEEVGGGTFGGLLPELLFESPHRSEDVAPNKFPACAVRICGLATVRVVPPMVRGPVDSDTNALKIAESSCCRAPDDSLGPGIYFPYGQANLRCLRWFPEE